MRAPCPRCSGVCGMRTRTWWCAQAGWQQRWPSTPRGCRYSSAAMRCRSSLPHSSILSFTSGLSRLPRRSRRSRLALMQRCAWMHKRVRVPVRVCVAYAGVWEARAPVMHSTREFVCARSRRGAALRNSRTRHVWRPCSLQAAGDGAAGPSVHGTCTSRAGQATSASQRSAARCMRSAALLLYSFILTRASWRAMMC